MANGLFTSHDLQTLAPEATSIVRVKNLATTIRGPHDAWGRADRSQPVLISAEVSLYGAFGLSSDQDSVAGDTVHYGQLSKVIVSALDRLYAEAAIVQAVPTLDMAMGWIWTHLTGLSHTGVQGSVQPFLDMRTVRGLTVCMELPKASLLGSGVRLTASVAYADLRVTGWSMSLDLVGLQVPTLVGVNPNEREAKQVVIANIGVERYRNPMDAWAGLEKAVVEALDKSTYDTLEALSVHLATAVGGHLPSTEAERPQDGWHIRISLEKPTAIPLAEAACVEFNMDTARPV